jgi:hypothetical protein
VSTLLIDVQTRESTDKGGLVQRLSEISAGKFDVVDPGRAPVYVLQVEDESCLSSQLSVQGPNPLGVTSGSFVQLRDERVKGDAGKRQ